MSISIISLPLPLILLIHLHILEYPQANKPEYDHNIFNPRVRGLRDRTKLMEDICYFLVGKLEGREGAKAILPMYPCLRPSETVAFRTSLSKYFETLRHHSLYPSLKTSLGSSGGKAKAKESIAEAESLATAWWWRDVVVRKSLLEECSGEKFERLLLSVSTHALLRGSSTIPPEKMSALFRSQPSIYSELLAKCLSTRHLWFRNASLLMRRQGDLKSLRDNLNSHAGEKTSRYDSLTTQKLVSLSDSKFNNLANSSWSSEEGLKVFHTFVEMAGMKLMTPCTQLSSDAIQTTSLSKNDKVTPPPALPIAAAHHPSNLRKLRKPIFNNAKTKDAERTTQAQLILSDSLNTEKNMYSAMAEALIKVKKVSESLAQRMTVLSSVEEHPSPKLDLWTSTVETQEGFNLNTEPTTRLLASFGLDISDPKGNIEDRMDALREEVLPPYPPVPDMTAPRLPATDSQPNVPSTSVSVQSVGLFGSPPRGGLFTSTPPASVKPPSAYLQRGKTSVRFSLARTRRPTLFQNVMNDEVDQIVHGTQDDSTEEPSSELQTPKRKQPVNRIWTAGSAKPKSTAKKGTPRDSFPMAALLIEPAMSLPSLLTSSLLHGDEDGDLNAMTPTFPRRDSAASWLGDDDGVDEGDGDDPPSMTLRDILLHADTSQFDLLDAEGDEDSMLGNDGSFEWN